MEKKTSNSISRYEAKNLCKGNKNKLFFLMISVLNYKCSKISRLLKEKCKGSFNSALIQWNKKAYGYR